MKKEVWILVLLGAIIVVLLGFLIFVPAKKGSAPAAGGIEIISPKINEEILSPLKIKGVTNGWNGFEGQVGTVKLFNNNGEQLGQTAILSATTDWTKPPVSFEATLNFVSTGAQDGALIFYNENPSGLPQYEKQFVLPVKIGQSSAGIITIKAYFNNNKMDPEISCNKVFAVERQVPQTAAVARAALNWLLSGPTNAEKDAGFFTSINSGVKIQSLTIENGTAYVDFDEQLEYQMGGSCRVSAIRAQITETLKQFSTVKNVIISINGRTEDILQP
jgi:hypothetical protein